MSISLIGDGVIRQFIDVPECLESTSIIAG